MSNGTAAPMSNGSLVMISPAQGTFLVMMGQTCYVPDPDTAAALFGSGWSSLVATVSPTQFSSLPAGPALTSGACLLGLGTPGSPQFLCTGGQCLFIPGQVYPSYPFQYGTLNIASQAVISAIPLGVVITS